MSPPSDRRASGLTDVRMKPRRATEAESQKAIIAAAKRGGWLVHAEPPSQRPSGKWSTLIQGHAGFPDLVLIDPGRTFVAFVELKRKPNNVEDHQWTWLDAVATVGWPTDVVRPAVWWVPEEVPQIVAALANGRWPEAVSA